MIRWRNSALPTIALGLSLTVLPGPEAHPAAEEGAAGRGRIALFAWYKAEGGKDNAGLIVVDPATDAIVKVGDVSLANGPISLADFRLSPDGLRIAYGELKSINGLSARHTSIWLRDLRPGSGPRKVGDIAGWPIWSPDGKELLVVEALDPDSPERPFRFRYAAWRMGDDGSHPVRLPIAEDYQVEDWSPDGRWLVGISPAPDKPRDFEIVVMHPDGTGRRSLTGPAQRFRPRFSPDGRHVAFVTSPTHSRGSMKGKSIEVVDLDGKGLRRVYLEPDDAHIEGVGWSPDGKHLVTSLATWTRIDSGIVTPRNPRLCIIDAADGTVRFVPHPPAAVLGHPQWR